MINALARWLWPLPAGLDLADLRERRKRFARFEVLISLLLFVVWGASGLAVWWVLSRLARVVAAGREPAEFVFAPGGIAWAFPAMMLGAFVAIPPMLGYTRLALGRGERYREYMHVSRYWQGFDAHKLLWALGALVIPFMVALTALFMDEYTLFTPRQVVIDPFFGVSAQRRPYADVAGVYEVQKSLGKAGAAKKIPHYAIRFRDGTTWRTLDFARQPDRAHDAAAMAYVAERAGVPLQRVATLPD